MDAGLVDLKDAWVEMQQGATTPAAGRGGSSCNCYTQFTNPTSHCSGVVNLALPKAKDFIIIQFPGKQLFEKDTIPCVIDAVFIFRSLVLGMGS
ncbi:MAG: hypothetical protein Q8J69_01055 [Sphingobacteriaceae bacterium]|nr:hypothetical protein [Sphingobacteriaceae bacterium]